MIEEEEKSENTDIHIKDDSGLLGCSYCLSGCLLLILSVFLFFYMIYVFMKLIMGVQ